MALSQKQIQSLAKKIAGNAKDTEFRNYLVIANILTLLIEQKPCYSQFEYLGKGGSALVLKAKVNNSEQVALKIEQFDQSNQKAIEAIQREYEIVKSQKNNEYIIKQNNTFILAEEEEEQENESIDVSRQNEEEKSKGFESANTVNSYFVTETELCQGNLAGYLDFLKKNKIVMEERMKIILVVQMLDAINYLHQQDIAHRNIKPLNFLYQEKEGFITLKLCDFGFASPFDIKNSKSYLSGKGTAGYTAPEVEMGQSRKESDLYSLGIIILEIDNSPKFNYSEVTTAEIGALQLGQGIFLNHNLNTSSILFGIAQTLLKPNYKERTSAKQILLDLLKQQHDILKNIPIYSIILGNQLSLLPFSIPQLKNKKAKSLQELKSISVSLPSSEITTKKKIDSLLLSYSNQENQSSLTQTQAEGVLRALFKKGDYDNFEILGAGSAGLIVGGMNLRYQRQSALKISLCENKAEIFRQISIMKICQMPRIVKFYGYQFIEDDNSNEYVVFEMEKCRCTLTRYLDEQCLNNKPYSAELKMELAIQMIDSLNYLHEHEILHRDIKLDNFLIKEEETGEIVVKLADFDQAAQLEENYSWNYGNEEHENELLPPYNCAIILDKQGTFPYYAPERFNIFFPTTKKTDTYALGVCLLILDNYLNFSENQFFQKQSALMNPYQEPFLEQKQIIIDRNSQIYNIVRKLLTYLPNNRIHPSKILANSNSLRLAHSRQIDYPFNQNNIQSICYFKKNLRKQKVEFKLIIDQISIMRNLSSLSLEHRKNSIKDSGANYLSNALSQFINLSSLSLNLSENSIGDLGASCLSRALSKLTNLSSLSLNLWRNSIKDSGVNYLSTALSKLTNLSSLSLNLSENSIGDSCLNFLSTALSKLTNLSLLSLNLYRNSIGDSGANYLSTSLSKLTNLSSLSVGLQSNSIGDSGANYVSTSLSKLTNLSNLCLDLYNNSIGDSGADYLSAALSKLINLSSLSLDLRINSIGESGANYLSMALEKLTNLSSLSLYLVCHPIGDSGANYVSTSLSKLINLFSLSLNFWNSSIGDSGANYISMALSKLINLSSLSLNLNDNSIGESGAYYLSRALKKLTNLSSLSLALFSISIKDSGANYLSTELSKLINISTLNLNLDSNSIGDSGANCVSTALERLINLSSVSLNLDSNQIKDSGAKYLSTALKKLTNLSSLSLALFSNSIGDSGANYLSTELSKFINLSSLSLNLEKNSIGVSGAYYVSMALEKLINLSSLSLELRFNSIKDSGACYLSTTLQKLTNLSFLSLNLGANSIGDSGANYLSTALSKLINLSCLSLALYINSIGDSGANYLSAVLPKLTNLYSINLDLGNNSIRESGANYLSNALEKLNLQFKYLKF